MAKCSPLQTRLFQAILHFIHCLSLGKSTAIENSSASAVEKGTVLGTLRLSSTVNAQQTYCN